MYCKCYDYHNDLRSNDIILFIYAIDRINSYQHINEAKLMEKSKTGKQILYIRLWHVLWYILTIAICLFTLWSLDTNILPLWLKMTLDSSSGILFGISILFIIGDVPRIMNWLSDNLPANSLTHKAVINYRFRTMLFSVIGIAIGSVYVIINIYYGVNGHFFWYIAMASYYVCLNLMKSYILIHERKYQIVHDENAEIKAYFHTGIMLLFTAMIMIGVVAATIKERANTTSSKIFIYIVSIYTFYKFAMAVLNLKTALKQKSYLVRAIRDICFADALMSMLHLEIVLLNSYTTGTNQNMVFFNSITGLTICISCLTIGLIMIATYVKNKKLSLDSAKTQV